MDEQNSELNDIAQAWSKRIGARATWFVGAGAIQQLHEMLGDKGIYIESLGGVPITVTDIKAAAQKKDPDACLVCDNTLATSFGCPAAQLGATLTIEPLDAVVSWPGCGFFAVSVGRALPEIVKPYLAFLDREAALSKRVVTDLSTGIDRFDERRQACWDNTQALAAYLVCHPKVREVRYPGIKTDPSFQVAATTLQHGFGPCVDFVMEPPAVHSIHRILASPSNSWLPLGIGFRIDTVHGDKTWFRLTCGHGKIDALIEALELLN